MEREKTILAATGRSLARAEKVNDRWEVSVSLHHVKVNSIIKDPQHPQTVYIGTQDSGVLVSKDLGENWENIGLAGIPVKVLAIDPQHPQRLYAGCKPVSLFVTENAGQSWSELAALRKTRRWWWFSPADPPGMTPYVNGLAVSPTDPDIILVGIELGAVMISKDRGVTWSKHLPGCDRDCHSLKFHSTNGEWAYEGGGIRGPVLSVDGGRTWQKQNEGIGTKYGWRVAADPNKPEIWYLSASEQANLLKG